VKTRRSARQLCGIAATSPDGDQTITARCEAIDESASLGSVTAALLAGRVREIDRASARLGSGKTVSMFLASSVVLVAFIVIESRAPAAAARATTFRLRRPWPVGCRPGPGQPCRAVVDWQPHRCSGDQSDASRPGTAVPIELGLGLVAEVIQDLREWELDDPNQVYARRRKHRGRRHQAQRRSTQAPEQTSHQRPERATTKRTWPPSISDYHPLDRRPGTSDVSACN
jgi:hypothetical protein